MITKVGDVRMTKDKGGVFQATLSKFRVLLMNGIAIHGGYNDIDDLMNDDRFKAMNIPVAVLDGTTYNDFCHLTYQARVDMIMDRVIEVPIYMLGCIDGAAYKRAILVYDYGRSVVVGDENDKREEISHIMLVRFDEDLSVESSGEMPLSSVADIILNLKDSWGGYPPTISNIHVAAFYLNIWGGIESKETMYMSRNDFSKYDHQIMLRGIGYQPYTNGFPYITFHAESPYKEQLPTLAGAPTTRQFDPQLRSSCEYYMMKDGTVKKADGKRDTICFDMEHKTVALLLNKDEIYPASEVSDTQQVRLYYGYNSEQKKFWISTAIQSLTFVFNDNGRMVPSDKPIAEDDTTQKAKSGLVRMRYNPDDGSNMFREVDIKIEVDPDGKLFIESNTDRYEVTFTDHDPTDSE